MSEAAGRKARSAEPEPGSKRRPPACGATGLETGYTLVAGRCFVGVARRRGRTLGVVLLDSPDPGRQAARLLNAGFRAG